MIIDELSEKESVSKTSLISINCIDDFKTLYKYSKNNGNEYQLPINKIPIKE